MYQKFLTATALVCIIIVYSCSKKHQPMAATPAPATEKAVAKKVVVRKVKLPVPKVIIVDDRAAMKTVDGRQYHDLEGRRYWKNYNDGKYYLFNNKMFADSAYRPH